MKQIFIDFNRYRRLGLKPREAVAIAITRFRVQRLLDRDEQARERAKQQVVRGDDRPGFTLPPGRARKP